MGVAVTRSHPAISVFPRHPARSPFRLGSAQLALPGNALVGLAYAFNLIFRLVALQRHQPGYFARAALDAVVHGSYPHGLADLEFVACHAWQLPLRGFLNTTSAVSNIGYLKRVQFDEGQHAHG
jgi:hypothetical protein